MVVAEQLRASACAENQNEPGNKPQRNPAAGSQGNNKSSGDPGGDASDWLHLQELLEPFLSIGRLGVGITHNLNGYLTGLIGHLELMQMKRPELGQDLDTILLLARRLRDGIGEISIKLDNELTREAQPQNLNQILRAALSFLKADLYFKHSIKVDLALHEPLPNVYGYYADFSLALEDVLLNAIDAQRDQLSGWLRIKSGSEGDKVWIEIEDGGPGFTPDDLATAFQPQPSEVLLNEDGSVRGGMGLALTRMRLERWGGSIAIGNRDEGGARVVITLPRRQRVPQG